MKKIIIIVVGLVLIVGYLFLMNQDEMMDADEVSVEVASEEEADMSFFVTSRNPGTGANFGGLVGADAHCQLLAEEVGAGEKEWRAYLSAVATDESEEVNAKDRIGSGPWYNAAGEMVASSVESLHEAGLTKTLALDESGAVVNGRGDAPNQHDILTGSDVNGMVVVAEGDTTCNNWTSEDEGSAFVGHHDRMGLDESDAAKSWNSSHGSRGCSLEALQGTGGEGLLYCFAL